MLDLKSELADIHDRWETVNFGARAPKPPHDHENYRNFHGGGVQFTASNTEDDHDPGDCSPPLWKTGPTINPVGSRFPQNNYRFLSPNSRAQAIARGRRELMEMVKNMPESCYELSLKDLVEHPRLETRENAECLVEEKIRDKGSENQGGRVIKRQESRRNEMGKAKTTRNRSVEKSGLLLKMVFPVSFRSSTKKKNCGPSVCSRVSPKPEASEKSSKAVEKEWWKKRFSSSTGSGGGSTGSSASSGSNSIIRRRSGCSPGCRSFFLFRTKKKNTG
ncbi:hypothetical protein U1Q18_037245 [Sarracenia purpurea var. burkii]